MIWRQTRCTASTVSRSSRIEPTREHPVCLLLDFSLLSTGRMVLDYMNLKGMDRNEPLMAAYAAGLIAGASAADLERVEVESPLMQDDVLMAMLWHNRHRLFVLPSPTAAAPAASTTLQPSQQQQQQARASCPAVAAALHVGDSAASVELLPSGASEATAQMVALPAMPDADASQKPNDSSPSVDSQQAQRTEQQQQQSSDSEEATVSFSALLAACDTDADGAVSREELEAAAVIAARDERVLDGLLRLADLNRDDKLSEGEFSQFMHSA